MTVTVRGYAVIAAPAPMLTRAVYAERYRRQHVVVAQVVCRGLAVIFARRYAAERPWSAAGRPARGAARLTPPKEGDDSTPRRCDWHRHRSRATPPAGLPGRRP